MEEQVVVLITAPSMETGSEITRVLLQQKLAACVNVIPSITSIYTWEGELCSDDEVLMVIKTSKSAIDKLATAVQAVHPYDVPEIIALPIVAGSRDYLNWIAETVDD